MQDYSWEDHGFSLVNRLYSDIGHLLDERFRNVASLPFPHSPDLKRAIWNYIHCIYGIRYSSLIFIYLLFYTFAFLFSLNFLNAKQHK